MTKKPVKQAGSKKKPVGVKSRFKPGQSGNPKGRPKKEHTFSDTAREMLAATSIDVTWTINGKVKTLHLQSTKNMHYGMAAALIMESLKGNVNAVRELVNRVEGRAIQTINADLSANGMNITIGLPEKEGD